jgi:hypothetical protein
MPTSSCQRSIIQMATGLKVRYSWLSVLEPMNERISTISFYLQKATIEITSMGMICYKANNIKAYPVRQNHQQVQILNLIP